MRTDRHTGMTKLIVAFRNFANASIEGNIIVRCAADKTLQSHLQLII